MSDAERGQVAWAAAEAYEEFFLPALFAQWSGQVADAASVGSEDHVLDVACGTGVLAREVAGRIGAGGSVIGVDLNEGMLAVARRLAPEVQWRRGRAEALPFDDDSFDRVVSQFGLMFFQNRADAVGEMSRVLRPGGRIAVAVWASLEETPGYAAMVGILARLFGEAAADALRAPYALGDAEQLVALFAGSFTDVQVERRHGVARFSSISDWVYTDVRGWTLADMIDDAEFELLSEEAERELQPFVASDGSVEFAAPALIVTAAGEG